MPSATSGRYQSRLFQFFHKQSRRWGEQFDRTKRHLQVAASWSLEALLYPVYLLIQKATESVGKLHTGEQQSRLQLQGNETDSQSPPLADTPIQQVLEAVVTLQVKKETNQFKIQNISSGHATSTRSMRALTKFKIWNFPIPSSPHPPISSAFMVQGIASLLTNRHLVLVNTDNELLDILTPKQQEKLQNRIIDELAKYWRSWQLAQVEEETKLLPEIDRLLNKLMGRRDTLPTLLEETKTEDKIQEKSLQNSFQGLALLDAAVAQLEHYTIVPVAHIGGQLFHIQNQLNIFLYGKQQQLTPGQEALAANNWNQKSNIQALIWGAINYFFGEGKSKKLEQKTPTNSHDQSLQISSQRTTQALPKKPDFQSENIADQWLTMNDLFGEVQEVTEVVNEQQSSVTSSSTKLPVNASSSARIRGHDSKSKSFHSPISQSDSESKEKIHQQPRKTTEIEAKPDWIEAQAQTIGYEKHPLEQILEWLDRIMLWLEGLFMNIVQFLRGLLRGK